MHDIDINFLKSRLVKEGYANNSATEATVKRLLSFSGEAASMLIEWLENGTKPSFGSLGGVDSSFLVDKLKMKAPALIIAYVMLKEDPKENAAYFKKLADNIIGFYPTVQNEF